eukprot:scaffold846_cov252-Pinguiococcus_pyrenoidosus.AAC.44
MHGPIGDIRQADHFQRRSLRLFSPRGQELPEHRLVPLPALEEVMQVRLPEEDGALARPRHQEAKVIAVLGLARDAVRRHVQVRLAVAPDGRPDVLVHIHIHVVQNGRFAHVQDAQDRQRLASPDFAAQGRVHADAHALLVRLWQASGAELRRAVLQTAAVTAPNTVHNDLGRRDANALQRARPQHDVRQIVGRRHRDVQCRVTDARRNARAQHHPQQQTAAHRHHALPKPLEGQHRASKGAESATGALRRTDYTKKIKHSLVASGHQLTPARRARPLIGTRARTRQVELEWCSGGRCAVRRRCEVGGVCLCEWRGTLTHFGASRETHTEREKGFSVKDARARVPAPYPSLSASGSWCGAMAAPRKGRCKDRSARKMMLRLGRFPLIRCSLSLSGIVLMSSQCTKPAQEKEQRRAEDLLLAKRVDFEIIDASEVMRRSSSFFARNAFSPLRHLNEIQRERAVACAWDTDGTGLFPFSTA